MTATKKPTLRVFRIGNATLYAVQNPKIAAAMMAFGHAWGETPETPEKIRIVLKSLDSVYADLVALKSPPRGGAPTPRSTRTGQKRGAVSRGRREKIRPDQRPSL